MNKLSKNLYVLFFLSVITFNVHGQLSEERIADLALIKVDRFQNILDLTLTQYTQLKKETINMFAAQGNIISSKNITMEIQKNLDMYYSKLSTLKPQQLATLKLMDSMDRQNRRDAYKDLAAAYGQNSGFAIAVAAHNWNVVMPILVSYRKDLDRYISPADRASISELRSKLIAKYNFITSIRAHDPSPQTESIIASVQDEILSDNQESNIPGLLQKYDERIVNLRLELKKHENQIKKDIQVIYEENMLENHRNQIEAEEEFISMLGISKLLKDSFLLLLDGDSRAASFKINALHIMANGSIVNDQF